MMSLRVHETYIWASSTDSNTSCYNTETHWLIFEFETDGFSKVVAHDGRCEDVAKLMLTSTSGSEIYLM
jgi:hypothetical protein